MTIHQPTLMDRYNEAQQKARGVFGVTDVKRLAEDMSYVYSKLLTPSLPKDKQACIYEAACGSGIFLYWAKKQGYTNTQGTDLSEEKICMAQELGLKAKQGDAIEDLGSKDKDSLDCIVAIDFVEHLTNIQMLAFLEAARCSLRAGGSIILRYPNGDSPLVGRNLYNDITHFAAYTSAAMTVLLKAFGFDSIVFKDETIPSIMKLRWLKAPIMATIQWTLSQIIRCATRERISHLSPSIYVVARKSH